MRASIAELSHALSLDCPSEAWLASARSAHSSPQDSCVPIPILRLVRPDLHRGRVLRSQKAHAPRTSRSAAETNEEMLDAKASERKRADFEACGGRA